MRACRIGCKAQVPRSKSEHTTEAGEGSDDEGWFCPFAPIPMDAKDLFQEDRRDGVSASSRNGESFERQVQYFSKYDRISTELWRQGIGGYQARATCDAGHRCRGCHWGLQRLLYRMLCCSPGSDGIIAPMLQDACVLCRMRKTGNSSLPQGYMRFRRCCQMVSCGFIDCTHIYSTGKDLWRSYSPLSCKVGKTLWKFSSSTN